MTDRPIIFSAPMIRALLAGAKTQTRRLAKFVREGEPDGMRWHVCNSGGGTMTNDDGVVRQVGPDYAPYQAGDRLWVREAHALVPAPAYRMSEGVAQTVNPDDPDEACVYRCGWERSAPRWRPSIHMPRWASRITLHVEDVRIQRVQDISEDDARAEGPDLATPDGRLEPTYRLAFTNLWNSIHGPDAWERNDWVVALTFRTVLANIDKGAA